MFFSESIGLKQLIALFVGRTYSEWKDPEVAMVVCQTIFHYSSTAFDRSASQDADDELQETLLRI